MKMEAELAPQDTAFKWGQCVCPGPLCILIMIANGGSAGTFKSIDFWTSNIQSQLGKLEQTKKCLIFNGISRIVCLVNDTCKVFFIILCTQQITKKVTSFNVLVVCPEHILNVINCRAEQTVTLRIRSGGQPCV